MIIDRPTDEWCYFLVTFISAFVCVCVCVWFLFFVTSFVLTVVDIIIIGPQTSQTFWKLHPKLDCNRVWMCSVFKFCERKEKFVISYRTHNTRICLANRNRKKWSARKRWIGHREKQFRSYPNHKFGISKCSTSKGISVWNSKSKT